MADPGTGPQAPGGGDDDPARWTRWAHVLSRAGRTVVVNGLSLRAVDLGPAAPSAPAPAPGGELSGDVDLARLRSLGLATTAQEDQRGLARLTEPAWRAPVLDLFVLQPVTTLGRSLERHAEHLVESIEAAQRAGALATVKLRLCGAERSRAEASAKLLSVAKATCDRLGLTLVSLLMGESLLDAIACAEVGPAVDAYFFRWRPATRQVDASALAALRYLVARGKLVACQLVFDDLAELEGSAGALRELADDHALARHPNVAWDVGLVDPARPFFLASVCQHEPARAAALDVLRRRVTDLGVPARAALAPFSLHPGCPLLLARAHVLLPGGRRAQCLDEATGAATAQAPRAAAAERAAAQLASSCAGCSSLPFCLARCPRLPAPVPDSPECLDFQARVSGELHRLLGAGHLVPLPGAAARERNASP